MLRMKAVQVSKPNGPFEVSVLSHVHPRIEKFPLEKAEEAFGKVMANRVRFRAVLVP